MDEIREVTMFGETEKEMREAAGHNLGDPVLLNGYAAAILSDAQEAIRRGDVVTANQWLNKAKYFIAESTRLQREKERVLEGFKALMLKIDPKSLGGILHLVEATFGSEVSEKLDSAFAAHQSRLLR